MGKKPGSNKLRGIKRQFLWPDHVRNWRVSRFDAHAGCDWNPHSGPRNENGYVLEAVHASACVENESAHPLLSLCFSKSGDWMPDK